MKGIIFNLLETVVSKKFGEDVWDGLIEDAEVVGSYTAIGNYSDEEMFALVSAASRRLSLPQGEVLKWFGREAMVELFRLYPQFFKPHQDSRSFVLSVNNIIHPEVRKLYAGADCPYFKFSVNDDGALTTSYRSRRKLCHLAEGFVLGAADHFGETVSFKHILCMHNGDPHCEFAMRWSDARSFECTAA